MALFQNMMVISDLQPVKTEIICNKTWYRIYWFYMIYWLIWFLRSDTKERDMILQDVLKPKLDIVFCGSAVGTVSAVKQAYYAGPGNKFYAILAKTGLTPEQLLPSLYIKMLEYHYGFTDMVKHVSGSDSILKKEDFDVEGFKKKIISYQPR